MSQCCPKFYVLCGYELRSFWNVSNVLYAIPQTVVFRYGSFAYKLTLSKAQTESIYVTMYTS